MNLQALAESPVIQRFGWTLLHSSWQGLAVAVGLVLILPGIRRRGARAAYAACLGALLLTIAMPAITFFVVPIDTAPRRTAPSGSSTTAMVPINAQPILPAGIELMVSPLLTTDGSLVKEPPFALDRATSETSIPKRVYVTRDASPGMWGTVPAAQSKIATPTVAAAPLPTISQRFTSWWREIPENVSACAPGLVAIWIFGVLALSLWNLGGWFAVHRLKSKTARPVSAAIQEAAARLAQQLGVRHSVRLLQSAIVESPVVIGALKPIVLLPASLITELPAEQLESLVAHELAHVLRHDYLVNLLQTAIETLLFYHPTVWWISAKVREERENCCDDLAIAVTRDRAVYLRALAAVAGARTSALAPAASGGVLVPRLRRILGAVDSHTAGPSRWLTGAAILSLCGGTLMFWTVDLRSAKAQTARAAIAVQAVDSKPVAAKSDNSTQTATKPSKAPAKSSARSRRLQGEAEFPTKGTMRVQILDTAGKPLETAGVQVSVWTSDEKFRRSQLYTTDAQGFATVKLPKTVQILRLWANKAGYCGEFKNFQTDAAVHALVIPDDYQFRLVKGTPIGGVIKDPDGRPIQGAKVQFSYSGNFYGKNVLTDADGRWNFNDVRPDEEIVLIKVTHPDYLSDRNGGEIQKEQKITTAALRAQTASIVLRRGLRIAGQVADPSGKPVKGAVLLWGDTPYWQKSVPPRVADAEGHFQFPVMPNGPQRITVLAKGWMPDSRMIEIGPGMQPANFQLKPGKKLRIRFVDRDGKPVPNVSVTIAEWRHVRELSINPNWKVPVPIPSKSNREGVYEWDWAPDDMVKLNISKQGFAWMRETPFTADGREHSQVMSSILQISGTVREAASGKPIDNFLAIPIIHFRPEFSALERRQARQEHAGRFALEFDRTDVEHGVQIEAPAYRAFRTSKRWKAGDNDAQLDIRLEPAPRFAGSLVDEAGRPVKNARVYRSTATEQFSLNRVEESGANEYDMNNRIQSDGNGRFEIAAPVEKYSIIALSPDGYGEVTRAAGEIPGQVRLARWAKVTGKLIQSGKPMPNCNVMLTTIRLGGGDEPHVFINLQTQTRPDGSFAFDRVPPGPCHVQGWLHFSVASPLTSSESVPLQLASGQAVDVRLGGSGIEVSGQLAAENQPSGFDYHFAINDLVARQPGIDPPAFLAGKGFDWHKGWTDALRNSPEGRTYLATLHTWFVKPEPDGRIRITGVLPGEYDFSINLYGSTEGCLVHPIAQRVVHFSVKPGDTKLDLGKLSIPSFTLPKVGDLASDFAFESPSGAKTSLAALRGNYVLIDFWATWCDPCVAKLDQIEHLREQFKGDKPLVVVGANLDAEIDRARDFLKKKPLPWHHAHLGDWSNTEVPRRFAISTVPAYVLIGPDGRILAHEYSLEVIEAKLKDLYNNQHAALNRGS
jgi:beta-lactamase regulating signal transducer with metallopeptidase domain/uncharacterized GH25 family protein/thiol-disulfide isomerase/thioredoxin